MKEKKIWRLLLTILVTLSMTIVMLPLAGVKTQAAEIGAMSVYSADPFEPSYGDVVTLPTINPLSTGNAEVTAYGWQHKGADVPVNSTFEDGEYSLYLVATIDHTLSSDTFEEYPTLTVNGEYWNFANLWEVDGNQVAYFYKTFTIDPLPVVTFDDESYSVPQSQVGVPITEMNLNPGVIGGNAPYSFVKESGPSWLNVSTDGRITGTPTTYGENEGLVIKITDNDGEEGKANLFVQLTKPDARAAIYGIDAKSNPLDLNNLVKRGNAITSIGFEIIDPAEDVAPDPSQEYWQKYDEEAGEWKNVTSGTFTEGKYRYWVYVYAKDKTQYSFVDPILFLEAEMEGYFSTWNLGSYSADESWAWFYSDEYIVPKLIQELTISGVPSPMDGICSSIYASIKEGNVFIDDAYWVDDDGYRLTEGDMYDGTKQYAFNLVLIPAEHFEFASASEMSIKVNGLTPANVQDLPNGMLFVQCQIPFAKLASDLYVVTAGSLNVRTSASYDSDRVGGLKYGDLVQAIAMTDDWVMFNYDEQNAWVNRNYLALTYSEETAIYPQKYVVTAGAVNVRSNFFIPGEGEPDNRIGSYTAGKEILVTGKVTNSKGEDWVVVDYPGDDGRQLGFVMAKYVIGTEASTYSYSMGEAKEDEPSEELNVHTGGTPAKVTISTKSALAIGNDVDLQDDNYFENGDGSYTIKIFPADGKNFSTLTIEKINLPADANLKILSLLKNEDGSIDLKVSPEVAYEVKFDTDGGSAVDSQIVPAGQKATCPATPTKEGYTFDRWYSDAACTTQFNFNTAITADTTIYGRWMVNVLGVKIHGYEIEEVGSGSFHLKMDVREAIFEKDTASVVLGASALFINPNITTPLTTAPVPGTTYYFAVTIEDIYGDEGRPLVCFGNAMKTGNIASAEEADVEYVDMFRSPGGKYATVVFSYTGMEITYTFSKGGDATWSRGSSDGLDYKVIRNINDDKTFTLFDRIEIDGAVVDASNYTAASGSLDATLNASYLETLSAGAHTVRIIFKDGAAETTLTIKNQESTDGTTDETSPKTGDSSHSTLYLVLIIASLAVMIGMVSYLRRQVRR
ncbi:MAG: InlB B-repeat-containing protein [Lachnospiraceae bacterium]|nr:InlB B-repeat-containing protein [Lachnospiraceae bacterium]